MPGNSTIQGAIDLGLVINVHCHNAACANHATLDLHALRDKLGPDHGALHDDLVPLLRCSKCGGRKVGIIISSKDAERAAPGGPRGGIASSYRKAKGE